MNIHTPGEMSFHNPVERNIFFVSDFHFDHTNIIKYCNRPFRSVEEMNETMLHNYLEVVKDDSLVFFLGDMAFGRDSRSPKHWLSKLRGRVIYIKGSHDHGVRPTNLEDCYTELIVGFKDLVYVTHEPGNIPHTWDKWAIHGHTHSTTMLDMIHKRVCVCVEAINYKPISLYEIREAIKRGHTNNKEVSSMRW